MRFARFFGRRRAPTSAPEAADWWLARRTLGEIGPREEGEFQAWLTDDENAAAWDEVQGVHEEAAAYAAEPEILELRQAALHPTPEHHGRGGWGLGVGVAASLAVATVAGLVATGRTPVENPALAQVGDGGLTTAKRYETRVGERRQVRLDDGSVVSLNTGSVLEVGYNPASRDVRLLRGQALFQVAHNRAWPFIVTVGDRRVTAVGTAFDVRMDGDRVKVVLVEGKVRVEPLQRKGMDRFIPQLVEEDLTAGEQLVARQGEPEVAVSAADVARTVSWRSGQVIFRDDTLAQAVAELNRYSTSRIVIDDPRIAALKVSGVFSTERPENFLAAVTTFYPLRAEQSTPGVTALTWR